MLATWARGTNWRDIFPLCRSKAFKLTSEVSIKKLIQLDHFDVQEPLQQSKYYYKIPDRFLERKIL